MVALDLGRDYSTLQKRLFDTHQIEIPVIPFEGRHFIRASFQPYNTTQDLERLTQALQAEL